MPTATVISGPRWHKNNRDLGFNFNSANVTDDVYSLDIQSGKLDRWTESETGTFDLNSLPEAAKQAVMRFRRLTAGEPWIFGIPNKNEQGFLSDLGLELQVIFNKDAVMVLPAGVNKATGLSAALKELDLSPHEVVGIGDAENDHAFLSLCECERKA